MEIGARFYDEIGPAKILQVYEPEVGLEAILVIDNVAAGPSIGGIRMAEDVQLEECFRLARGMTLKNIAAGIPHGGGKVVMRGDPKMDKGRKEQMVRALACSLRDMHEYILAPDMGMNEECMAWIKDEIGRVVGLPTELGGIPLDEIGATGWGLFHAIDVSTDEVGLSLGGSRIVVQGYGAVGRHAATFLAEAGARLVGVADSSGAIANADGIDVQKLNILKESGRSVVEYEGAVKIDEQALVALDCDIWIPAARPDVIHDRNAVNMRAKIVAQGANIPCTVGAEKILAERGILCLPDFIVNAGGVICAAMEYAGLTRAAAMERIKETLRSNTTEILARVRTQKIIPRQAANEFAMQRLRKVMATRRWHIF